MMRSPASAERPVVSVSRTIWRTARLCLSRSRFHAHQEQRMFDLKGKVAVVTGGNGGIGLGMARGLGRAGATVVIAARNAEKSREAAHELRKEGCHADAIEADVTDEGEVARLFEEAGRRHGRLDIVV